MTIHYDVTEHDYINFNLYHLKTSKSGKMLHMFVYRIAPLIFFIIPILRIITLRANAEEIPPRIIISFFVAVLGAVLYYVSLKLAYIPMLKWLAKAQLKDGNSNDFIGPQTITLHDDYVEDTNTHMTTRINYSAVEKICCGYNCLFIYIGAVKGIIVPLRSFANTAEKDEFVHLMKQKTGLSKLYYS